MHALDLPTCQMTHVTEFGDGEENSAGNGVGRGWGYWGGDGWEVGYDVDGYGDGDYYGLGDGDGHGDGDYILDHGAIMQTMVLPKPMWATRPQACPEEV